jgi:nucleoside phosphorylase/tetratricopeptide (TPR) repeat protein
MKIVETHSVAPISTGLRKRRLEALLSAWRMPRPLWHPLHPTPPEDTTLTAQEWPLWLEILRAAVPVLPSSHVDGLRARAELAGLRLEDLERDKAVLVIDDQVAVRLRPQVLSLRSHEWGLLVPATLAGQPTEAVLTKRFRGVELHGDRWLVSGAWEQCTDSLSVLVAQAVTADAPTLEHLWKLSLALWLEGRFFALLPAAPAKVLAELLGAALLAASGKLKAITDVRLALFAAGQDAVITTAPIQSQRLPQSRLSDLLELEQFFDHSGSRPGEPYYSTLASAFSRIADVYSLGNVLLKLDASAALLAALEAVVDHRPDFIAIYVWHPSFHAEGAFALLQLPQKLPLAQGHQLDLREEWLEVQQLGRELLLLGDPSRDWSSLTALGVHDESDVLRRRHHGRAGFERDRVHYDAGPLWAQAASDEERSKPFVAVLEGYLRARARRSGPAMVFALRLHAAVRDSQRLTPARSLAGAIVDGYAAGLALDIEVSTVPGVLCAYGGLLARLGESLDRTGDSWRKLMHPFDREAYIAAARADDGNSVDSRRINAAYDVPHIFRAHAETLVALAGSLEAFHEPLQAALELYDADRRAQLPVDAFSWSALARITGMRGAPACEPLFITVGRLLGRDPEDSQRLDTFLRDEHPVHILSYVAAGLGGSHPFAETIQPILRGLVNKLLSADEGVAIGEALELANVLQQAGIPRDAERLARLALENARSISQRGHDPYSPVGRALLAGSLAQQGLWAEVLLFEPEGNAMVLSTHARFVENMRALALLESERFAEASEVLDRVLKVDPENPAALVNRTALHLRSRDWNKAIAAAEDAKQHLQGDNLDHVLLNEAHAREQLGDRFGAARALDALAGSAKARADVVAAREELRQGRSTSASPPEIASGGVGVEGQLSKEQADAAPPKAPAPPDEGIDIAIVTALPREYDAVLARLINPRDPPQVKGPFPNVFAWKLGEIPKADGSGTYKVVLAQAQQSGNIDTHYVTMRTIDRWNPDYLIFSGIAGGMKREELQQGDVVLSQNIWYYDYGKIADKKYKPRNREFPPHGGLFMSAHEFGRHNGDWKRCNENAPLETHVPKCVPGLIGSGDKVIDDLKPAFVRAILRARPDIQAVEMEAAGAATAIRNAQQEGRAVGFMMVRGVSDMPSDSSDAAGSGTRERDDWKPYASTIAAHFIVSWIASPAWPFPPRAAASPAVHA